PPAPALPGRPRDARRARLGAQVLPGELRGPGGEPLVRRPALALRRLHLGDHPPHPLALLDAREAVGDRDDEPPALAEGGHGALAASAAADLDVVREGLGGGGHGSTLAPAAHARRARAQPRTRARVTGARPRGAPARSVRNRPERVNRGPTGAPRRPDSAPDVRQARTRPLRWRVHGDVRPSGRGASTPAG